MKPFSAYEAKAMAERVSPLPVSVSGGPADSKKTGHSKSKSIFGGEP